MTKEELYAHPGWRWCTSEGSREFDRLRDMQLTFREKLEWLEEAETLLLQNPLNLERHERKVAQAQAEVAAAAAELAARQQNL